MSRRFKDFLSWLVLACWLGVAGGAHGAVEDPERAAREVIMSQIAAFATDDAETAWRYASDAIQAQFGSPELFIQMVQQAYPAVYRAGSVKFRELVPHPGFMVQRLLIVDSEGRYWDSYYTLVEHKGRLRIGGVILKPAGPGI